MVEEKGKLHRIYGIIIAQVLIPLSTMQNIRITQHSSEINIFRSLFSMFKASAICFVYFLFFLSPSSKLPIALYTQSRFLFHLSIKLAGDSFTFQATSLPSHNQPTSSSQQQWKEEKRMKNNETTTKQNDEEKKELQRTQTT